MDDLKINQPLEVYRVQAGRRIADVPAWLGIDEATYLQLVTGEDDTVSAEVKAQIAQRLAVPVWLIHECAPPPTPEQIARIDAALNHAHEHGWIAVDPDTLEPTGEIVFADEPPETPRPLTQLQRAQALLYLEYAHRGHDDPDYLLLRSLIDAAILKLIEASPADVDTVAWAYEVVHHA